MTFAGCLLAERSKYGHGKSKRVMGRSKLRFVCLYYIFILFFSVFLYNVPVFRLWSVYDKSGKIINNYDNVISTYDAVQEKSFDSYCRQWDRIPCSVRDGFTDDGWDIVVCGNKLCDGNIDGITVFREHRIYLDACDGRVDSIKDNTLLHEMGHYLHYRNIGNRLRLTFLSDVMQHEGCNMTALNDYVTDCRYLSGDPVDTYEVSDDWQNVWYMSDSAEYMAEAFKLYVMLPSELERLCPKTYEIINDEVMDI